MNMKLTKKQRASIREYLYKHNEPGDIRAAVRVALRLGRRYPVQFHSAIYGMIARYN